MHDTKAIKNIKWATRQRLMYIETKAYYTGVVSRSDVARTFAMSDPAATKDLKLYNDLAPSNLIYKQSEFGFIPAALFEPILSDLNPNNALQLITQNNPSTWLATEGAPIFGLIASTLPKPIRLPSHEVVAELTRAIFQRRKVEIGYASLKNNTETPLRTIEPHSLVNTGLRWHVRAYNEESFDFRDFVLSRITQARLLNQSAESNAQFDEDWSDSITLTLAPHPALNENQQQNLMIDYSEDGRVINLTVRRALIAYVLHAMSVDTTADHSLNPNAFQLVLLNREEVEVYAGWALL